MDGFAGYHTATTNALPDAVPVMDPFHVVQLAGQKLTACRQRLQQQIQRLAVYAQAARGVP